MSVRPRTLYEKIWDAHVVERRDDGTCLIYIDRHLVHEVTSPQAFEGLRLAGRKVRRPDLTLAVADHNLPTTPRVRGNGGPLLIEDPASAEQLAALEENVAEFGVPYIDAIAAEQGIVHVVGPEQGFTLPGTTVVCGDSHTAAHGALGALAFGIGTSEVEHVLATQTLMLKPSRTLEIRVDGELGFGVTPKDLILAIIGQVGTAGGTGHVIEYRGSTFEAMSIEGRLTVANMSIEAGARSGLFAPDEKTFAYLKGRPMAPKGADWDRAVAQWRQFVTDPGATFDRSVHFDAASIAPTVTWGTSPEDVVPITGTVPSPDSFSDAGKRDAARRSFDYMGLEAGQRIQDIAIEHVFIGSCTNSRIEDLRAAASRAQGPQAQRPHQAGAGRPRLRPGEAAGRSRRPRPHLHRRGLRMARAGLLDVPGDEPGQGAAARALRVDVEPQLRRPSGPRRAHAPDVAGHGRCGCRHRPPDGRTRSHEQCRGAGGMTPFTRIEGRAYPLPFSNIDTDLIIPAVHLKTIRRSGLGQHAFEALRATDGSVFDDPAFQGAPIIVALDNFGCGSSREHAAWALADLGVRAVIAPSFSDIFASNAFKNGIATVELDHAAVDSLLRDRAGSQHRRRSGADDRNLRGTRSFHLYDGPVPSRLPARRTRRNRPDAYA